MSCAPVFNHCVAVAISRPVVPKLRFDTVRQESSECTQSWGLAVQALHSLRCEGGTFCDVSVEDSFLNYGETVRDYQWIGFSHTSFGDGKHGGPTAKDLFLSDNFRGSLATCKGIFVFSA